MPGEDVQSVPHSATVAEVHSTAHSALPLFEKNRTSQLVMLTVKNYIIRI